MNETYQIRYARDAADDIHALRAFDRQRILGGIEQYLTHQPTTISRSRIKRMIRPFWSQYRLRIGEFRIYYDVDSDDKVVNILRVLRKTTQPTPGSPP